MSNNIFPNPPAVLDSFCIFLDILGFKAEVVKQRQANNSTPHLLSLNKAITKASQGFNNTILWEQKFFTDNIVLGSPIGQPYTGEGENNFWDAIPEIINYQLSMILDGFFIRGGWSHGELYMNDNLVYGCSLIEAYLLESNVAIYPRIVFSDKMKTLLDKHINYYRPPSSAPQRKYVLKDVNGIYFINYLMAVFQGPDDDIDYSMIKKHKDIIESRIQTYRTDITVLSKYEWSASYHNFFLSNFINNCPANLFINTGQLQNHNFYRI